MSEDPYESGRKRFEVTMLATLAVLVLLGVGAWSLRPGEPSSSEGRFVQVGGQIEGRAVRIEPPVVATIQEAPVMPLPPPGEQPADLSATREAVAAAFVDLFSGTTTREEKLAAIDDPTGLEPVMDRVANAFPIAAKTSLVSVLEIVFTSPETAFVRFHLSYQGAADLGERIGEARIVDGRWKVRRQNACEIYALAGSPCP